MTENTRHETPDVAELRSLAEAAAGEFWYSDDELREHLQHDKANVDVPFILAAAPDVVLSLLDRLAHMTEARDNARAEVERLAGLLAEVREWIDRRGVNVDDRDDDYMRGYRDAQRHARLDANELRALLDATPETGGES